jgi:hypothetical protein
LSKEDLRTIILPGKEEEEAEEEQTPGDAVNEQEAPEHEKEWELLCQQYRY